MRKACRGFLVVFVGVTLAVACLAQAGPNLAPKRVVMHAGRVLDVKTGKMLSDQAIVIDSDKIVSVGPAAKAQTAGATVVDLPNATVLPGLIDAHTHITFDQGSTGYPSLGISTQREALVGAKNARITLQAGFTTVRNVGARL